MTNWHDLPAEVKQIIFSYVPQSHSIIYVPKDNRKKVDKRYKTAAHFHNILLVSKTFITAEEFAFAILARGSLKFNSYNELRRFVTEVGPAVGEAVRCMTLVRHFNVGNHKDFFGMAHEFVWKDGFGGFSGVQKTLSTHFPNLQKITISTTPYCANLVQFARYHTSSSEEVDRFICALLGSTQLDLTPLLHSQDMTLRPNALQNAMASCIADRNSRAGNFAWLRPEAWLRRLVAYAEEANIEIIFNIDLCIEDCRLRDDLIESDTVHLVDRRLCFAGDYRATRISSIHIRSETSTKDYMLKVVYDDVEYKFHQKLAFDMLHAEAGKHRGWWMTLLSELEYTSRPGSIAF